ncbi:hypothetical protein Tco_0711145 [Tanacetum coccineum]
MIRETTEMIVQIKNRLLAARSRQKSYADVRRKPLEFEVGDKVMLKVSPWKGVVRFRKRGKLSPRNDKKDKSEQIGQNQQRKRNGKGKKKSEDGKLNQKPDQPDARRGSQ